MRDHVDGAQAVKTLAHELGHIRADHEHRFPDYAVSRSCRGRAEVEAESIAYLVTTQAGVDSTAYSVPYLAGWSGGTTEVLRESMAVVVAVAREVTHGEPEARSTVPPDPAQASDLGRVVPLPRGSQDQQSPIWPVARRCSTVGL